ncbi:hypothetical protein [Ferrimonas balearica]|uniref:hypothetical protein n=1 Tax=Ferrimonas balearica TaxID=44012 RepID=UPI001C583350|nr:hypothetical protein [Ferrimonas balearica]MBY6016732.1 hypothetical protein [Halomonas denitrificans]MBW3139156.1 hypothetical protein [Ferrimonas balearica]MBW3163251.1 hypothetical protein [Ferrimonas balearica]MBY6094975.1 hypothetical protein [Ferrimonas balearica]MBY6106218.1 hypothetical protein [Ferrimonas balearica]
MTPDPFDAKPKAPFSLMRIDVSFELAPEHVAGVERALGAYVDHPDVQTEIVTCGYDDGLFQLQLCYFSTTGRYRNELAWLHKAVQSVVVPVPVFTVQIRED